MLGTENLKKLIDLGFAVPKQIAESLTDGWQITDIFSFTDEALELVRVARSWKDIVAEFKDLDENERIELHTHFAAKFDLPNDQVEEFVEDALMHGVITVRMVERFKDLRN